MSQALIIDRVSSSARAVATALGVRRVHPERAPRLRRYSRFINWGVSSIPFTRQEVLNRPEAVATAVSKRASYAAVLDLCPPWSTEPHRFPGITLARRDNLSGGQGIVIVRADDPLPRADFYTKYIKKLHEYRVHVVRGSVIALQQKRKRNGAERNGDAELIRNHDNGWVFCINRVTYPTATTKQELEQVAVLAVERLGLDFAAVDLIVEKGTNRVYFLEANTRPGLDSPTVTEAYANALRL